MIKTAILDQDFPKFANPRDKRSLIHFENVHWLKEKWGKIIDLKLKERQIKTDTDSNSKIT